MLLNSFSFCFYCNVVYRAKVHSSSRVVIKVSEEFILPFICPARIKWASIIVTVDCACTAKQKRHPLSIAVLDLGVIRFLSDTSTQTLLSASLWVKPVFVVVSCSNGSVLNKRGRVAAYQMDSADCERDLASPPSSRVVSVGIPIMQSFSCFPFSRSLGVQW